MGGSYPYSSRSGRRRRRFNSERAFLSESRRLLDARVGRVGRLGSDSRRASRIFSTSLRRARARLRNCDLDSVDDDSTTVPTRSVSLVRTSSGRDECTTLKARWTAVLLLLACWPPGPPDVSNRSSISDPGMVHSPMTRSSMGPRLGRGPDEVPGARSWKSGSWWIGARCAVSATTNSTSAGRTQAYVRPARRVSISSCRIGSAVLREVDRPFLCVPGS